ncbi:MAG: pseudouridine synthase, partial [Rhodanobacteraceae bacterium]
MVILFNKPYGVLCQFTDRSEPPRPTLAKFIATPNVYPAGRLDFDSEGLLVLTDDGDLAHALTDPRFAHPRTYWAQVENVPDAAALRAIAAGVLVQGRRTQPAGARLLEREAPLPSRPVPIRFRKAIPTA